MRSSRRSASSPRRLQSSALLSRANHLETITRATIPVRRSHAANDVKLFGSDTLHLAVEQFVIQVNALDQTNHDAIIPNVQRAPFFTFQARRGLGNPRR